MTKNNLPVIDNTNQGNKITAPVRNKKKGLPSLPNSNNDSQPLFTSPYKEKDDEGNWTTAGIFAEANRRNMSGDTDNARAILSEYRAGLTTQGSRYYNPYYAGANIDEKKGTTATKNTELFRQDMNTMFNDVQWYVAAGYSDAWIKSHVSVMNYSQLAKMEENASYGTPLAMTGTVDYMGEDTVNGMIYAARNGEDLSGGLFTAVGLHYMGMGNQWEADSSKIAALDVTNDEGYDPYSYFGVSGDKASTYARKYGTTAFTSEWLSNPENKRKAAENGDYEYISNLIANTDATVEERNRLYETAYKRLEAGATPEEVYEYYFGKGEGSDPMRVLQKGDEYSAYESDANGYKHLYDMEYRRQMKGASDLAYDVPFTATAFKRYLNDANSEITMNKRYAAVKEQTNIYTNSVPERYWDSVLGLFMWTKGMDDLSTEEATEMVQSPEFMAELNTFVTDNGLTVENASEFDADANGQAYAEKIYGIEQRVMGEREEEQARADAEKAASIEIDPGWTASKFISEADVSTPEGSAEMAEFNLAMDNYFSGKPVTDENAAAMIEKYPWLFDQVEGRGTAKKMTTQQKSMLSYASAGAGTMSGMPGVGSYIDTDTYTEEGKTVTVYSQGQNAADFFGEDDWQHDGDSIAYKMHHAYTEWQDGNLSSEMYYSMLARIASACEQYGVEGVKSDTDGVISALFSDVEANIAENKNNKVESIKRNGTSTIQRYNDISARLKANGADSLSEDEKGFYWNVTNAVFSSDISQTPFHFSGNDSALESGRFYTMYEGERVSLYDYMDRAITDRFSRQARNSEFANIQFSIGDAEYFDQITGTTASYISGYAQDQLITMQRWSAYTGMSIEDTLQAFGYSDFDDFCARSYGEGLKELESANLSVTNEVKNEMHLIEGSMDYYLRIGEGVSEAYGKAYDPEKWTESFKETDARETGSAAGALGVTPETAEEVYGTSNNFFQIAGRGIATGSVDFWGSWVDSAYQFIRMDPEERDEYFRGTFSREEMRSVIEERINGIENKELREYYQEYYRNYTGDIYDFDIEFYGDELYLRDWSANIQETSRAMREEAQAILSPEAYRRYEITAGATLSIESSIVTALETYALVKMGMPSAAAGLIAQLNTTGFVTAGESLGELKDQGVYDKSGYAIAVGALTALSEWGMGEMVFKYLAGPKTMKYLDSATTLDSKAIAARFGRFLANRGTSPALVKLGTGAMRYGSAGLNIILQTAKSSVGNSVQEVAQDQYQKMGIALATGKSVSEGWLSCDEARSTFWTSIEQGLVQSVMQSPYSAIHAYSDAKAQRKSDKSARAEINGMIGQQAEAVTAVKRASNETNDEISRLNAELDGIIAEREEAYNGHFDEGLQAEAESRATKYVEEHIMEVADSDVVREEKATDAELEAAKSLLAEFERTAEDNRGEANAAVQAVEEGDTSKEALDYANERVGLVVESDNKVSAQNEKIAELEARREELKRQHKALSDGLRDRAYQQANDEVREIAVQMYDEQIRAKQANLEVLSQRKEELKNRAEEVKRTFRERYEAAKNNIREQAEYANYKHDENGNLVMDDGEAVQIHDVNPEMQFAFFDRVVDELFEDDAVFEKDNALKMNLADQLRVAFPGFNIEFVNDPNYNGAVSVKGKTLRLNANISTARLMSGTLIHEITHICKMSKDYGALFRSATTAVYGTQEAATEAYAEFIKNHPAYDTAVPVDQDYGSYTEMQDEFLAETMEKALGAAGQLTTSSGSVSAYHVDWIKAFAKENVFLAKDLSHWLKMRGKELKKFAVLSKNSAVKKTYNNLAEVVNTLTDLVKDVKRWYDVDEQTADTAETAKPTKKEKAKRKQRAVNEAYVSDLQERADKLNTPAEQTAEETEAPVNQNVTDSAQNASVSDSESISVDTVDNTAEAVDTSETAPASDSAASEVTEDEKLEPLEIEGDTEVLESLAASEGVENFELIYDMPLMAKQDDGTWVALGDTTKEQDAVIEIINQNPNTASAVSAAQVGDLSPESIVEQASIALDSKLTTEQKKAKLKGPTAARVKMLTKMAQADPVQLNVNDIKVDAETYQFKGGSNEEGVTDSDAITGDYSEGLLDPITVYERKNGDYYVINGHHRLALAKANGADTIRATVIHESDGVTEETARVFGAVQNMAQGKGTALDAAKIFREAKIEPTAASLKAYGLSADKGTIDKAAKFAVLSDENFNNLVAGGLSEDTAYVMGKYFADDVQRQNDFAKYVFDHRAQQFTRRQLEILAEEMLRAEYRENTSGEVQASLFDVEGVAPAISNLDERVKLIDSISKSLSQTKNLLTRTNNNAETLTENGNVIATDNNASVVKGTEQARYVLDNRNVNGADAIIGEYAAKIASGDMSIKEATAEAIKDMNGILTAQQTNDVRYQEDTADEDANRAMLYALHNELETAQETMSAADYAKAAGRIIGRIRNLLNDDDKLDTPVRIIKRLADTMGTHIYEGFRDPKQNKAFYEHARAILANKVDASVFGDLMGQVADSVLRGNPNFANQSEDGVYTIAGKSYTADNVNQMFAQWFTKGNGRSEIMRDFDAEMMRYLGTQDAGYRYDVLQARDRMREYFKAEDIRRVGAYVAGLDEKRMQNKRGWRAAWNNFAEAFIDSTVIADQIDSLTGYQSRVREYARYENYGRNTSGNLVSGNRFDDVDGVDTGLKTLSDRLEPILGDAHKTIHENNRKMNLIGEVLMIQSALDRIRNGKNPFTDGTYMAEGEYIGGLATLNEKTLENAYDQIRTEHPEMVEAAKVTREWFQDVLRVYAVDTGMLDEATYTKWQKESPNYAPLMRFMDAETGYGDDMIAGSIGSVKANNLGLTFMKAKGNSDRVVINPLQSMVAMANTMVNKAMSNRTAQEFVRVYDSVGNLGVIGTEITEEQALAARNRNERVLAVFYNSETDNVQDVGHGMEGLVEGETTDKRNVRYFVLNNSSLFDLLSGTRKVYNNRALETIGKLTKTMTMLTTGVNPLFAFKNAVRDFQHSVIYGSYAYSMADALPKWLSAFVEVAKSKFAESFDEWLFDGKKGWGKGSQQLEDFKALGGGGITRYGSSQNMNVRQLNNDLFGESFARRTASGIGKVLTFGTLNEAIEMTTRYAEYKYGRNATLDSKGATAESKHAAFMSSREATVDFAVKGNSAISYAFRKLFPFFNAQLQGVYQEGRMFSQSQRSELGSRLIKSATNYSLMGALSALACMAFGAGYDADADDDKKTALSEYLNLSDDVKRGYILLPLSLFGVEGSRDIVRVPIVQDFVSNVFYEMGRSGVETVMRATHGEEVGVDDWAVDMFGSAFELLVGQFESEPIWTPISDVRNNRTWYDGTLIRSNLLSKAIPQQYNSGTGKAFIKASAFFNGIAQALGLDPSKWSGYENIISPLGLEYLTQQYTGVIGQLFIPALSPDSYTGEMPKLGSSIVRTFTKGWTLDADSSTDIPDTYESGLDELTAISKSSGSIGTGFLPYGLTKSQYKDAIAEADYLVKNDFKDLNERINDCWSNYTAAMSDSTMTLTQREEAAEAYRKEILRLQGEGIKKYNDYKRKYSVDTTLMGGIIGMVRSVDEQMPVVSNPEKNMYTTRRTYEDSALELPDGYEEEVLRLADATKTTSTTIYGTPPVSFEKDKTTYKPEKYEGAEAAVRDWYGEVLFSKWDELVNSDTYISATDEGKVELIKKLHSEAREYAKNQFFKEYVGN